MPRFGEISAEELAEDSRNPANFMIIGMLLPPRPNFKKFMTALEYGHYHPSNQALNDKFRLAIVFFEGMTFGVITIPAEDRPKAEKVATEHGLRFAAGVPMVMAPDGGAKIFPVSGPHAWSVESVSSSDVYKGPAAVEKMLDNESKELERFFFDEHNKN